MRDAGGEEHLEETALGSARYILSVRTYSSSRSSKYFPRLLNTSLLVIASTIRRRSDALLGPPASKFSSSRASKLALERSRAKSSRGSLVLARMTAVLGSTSARVCASTLRACADMIARDFAKTAMCDVRCRADRAVPTEN